MEALRSYRANGGGQEFGAFLADEEFVSPDGVAELSRALAEFGGNGAAGVVSAARDAAATSVSRAPSAATAVMPERSRPPDAGAPPGSGPTGNGGGPGEAGRTRDAAAEPDAGATRDTAATPDAGATLDSGAARVSAGRDQAPAVESGTAPRLDCPPGTGLEDLLRKACALGVSDLHLHSGAPLSVRIHGVLRDVSETIDAAEAGRLLYGLLTDEQRNRLEQDLQLDFAFQIAGTGRFRANAYHQQRGVDAVFRAIPPVAPCLEELGLPDSLAALAELHQGIVLFTGPAGCGKSSTMAAVVRVANERRRDHILIIEDPIEFQHASGQCVVNQRQVGPHTESFARALRAALREDPDVIVIGELRDLETISLALTAAETGHLVLATLHTSGAVRTLNRILGVIPPDQQAQIRTMFSESLRAVISQRLALKADGSGRVPALEVLPNTKAIANLIRDNKTYQIISLMQTGGTQGMRLLDDSLGRLVKDGIITKEEAQLHAEVTKFA